MLNTLHTPLYKNRRIIFILIQHLYSSTSCNAVLRRHVDLVVVSLVTLDYSASCVYVLPWYCSSSEFAILP